MLKCQNNLSMIKLFTYLHLLFVSVHVVSINSGITQNFYECEDSYECQSESFSGDRLVCYGFKSCLSAPSLYVSDDLYCMGGYACSESINTTSVRQTECWGGGSCANIDMISVAGTSGDSYLDCDGFGSCQYSTISVWRIVTECAAELSCLSRNFVKTDDIFGLVLV